MMNKYLKHIVFFLCIFLSLQNVNAQTELEGEVSFVTSGNVYVRFLDTELISEKDTLWLKKGDAQEACLEVKQKSSSSCVCTILNNCKFQKGDKIYYKVLKENKAQEIELMDTIIEKGKDLLDNESKLIETESIKEEYSKDSEKLKLQKIRARISASTYSSFDERENRHRAMMRFSLNANNINDSRISFEMYSNYRNEFKSSSSENEVGQKSIRIYNAAISYDLDSLSKISIGRKVNRKMSSIGAIDGLQLDKSFGGFYTGLVVGFRPDHTQFNLNSNLLQYGVYFGKTIRNSNTYGQLTFGVLEQRNSGQIDRRYTYGQYNISLFRKLSVFASAELDIYSKVNKSVSSKPRLTNLYASLNYRFSRKISLMVSYDARKNIIYYETFQTEIERLLADDEARQGVRVRLSIRPIKMVYLGVSYSKRYQVGSANKFDNINGFVSLSKLPSIGGRMSLTFNRNASNYLESQIYSVRYNRNLLPRKLDVDVYYRHVDYLYLNYENKLQQEYYGLGLNYRIHKSLSLSLFGELSKYSAKNKTRINTKLIKRF